jgi:polar amino acid transport system substrate-binding protein
MEESVRSGSQLRFVPLTVAALLAVAACGSGSNDTPTVAGPTTASTSAAQATIPPVSADSALFALLPKALQSSKTARAATDGTYPPNEFAGPDGSTLIGFDLDLAKAIGDKIGITVKFDNAKFDSIITGIVAGRYDLSLSSFTDNAERQKKVDFVDYFTAGTSILVKKGNPEKITTLEDLCGKPIALESGTVQVTIAKAAKCAKGNEIKVTQLPDDATARLQVKTGRAVADMNDFPVAAYTAETSGNGNDFEVVGTQYETAPYGVAVSKSEPGLRDAVKGALTALIADGTYAAVLKKWNIAQGAISAVTVNAGT